MEETWCFRTNVGKTSLLPPCWSWHKWKTDFFFKSLVYRTMSFARQDLQSRLAGEPGAALLMCLISDQGARLMYSQHPVKTAVTCIPMLCCLPCRHTDQDVCRRLKWVDLVWATPAAFLFRRTFELFLTPRNVLQRHFLKIMQRRMQYWEFRASALLVIMF